MADATIYSRFYTQVKLHPHSPAIIEGDTTVSYFQLNCLIDDILHKIGTTPRKAIGIVMHHGTHQVAAMLAVLKSGACYVPAEPTLPQKRIDYMMRQAGVGLIINDEFCHNLPSTLDRYTDLSTPHSPAYVLFTSGTTGHPKGVVVANSSVVNYAEAFEAEFHTAPGDVMLQLSVCSFDIFVEEVFTTLLNGATLAIAPPEVARGTASDVLKFAEQHGVTIISGFPYLVAEFNKIGKLPPSLRLLISGGDVLRGAYIDHINRSGIEIYNTYGPSETTVCATYQRCDNIPPLSDGTFPVGHPVKGVEVKIEDAQGHEVPTGTIGEICIYGQGVGLGYVGNVPEQSNFVTLPDGSRKYRSGDMGYILPDGNLAFLYRRDQQVMILGKRVEPEEVENVLNESPDVERAAVRAFKDEDGLSYLVAYFVPKSRDVSLHKIKEFLAERLTDFMIPEFFVAVPSIPINRRGKVDMQALPIVLKEGVAV